MPHLSDIWEQLRSHSDSVCCRSLSNVSIYVWPECKISRDWSTHTHTTTNKQKLSLCPQIPGGSQYPLLTRRACCACPHGSLTCENQGWISRNTARKGDNFTLHSCFLVPSPLSQEAASLHTQSLSSLIPFLPTVSHSLSKCHFQPPPSPWC